MNKKHVIIAALLGVAAGLGIAKAICWMKAKKESEKKKLAPQNLEKVVSDGSAKNEPVIKK